MRLFVYARSSNQTRANHEGLPMNTDFSECTVQQLTHREGELVRDLNQEFASRHVDHCSSSLSPLQSKKILQTIEELTAVLEEMERRRKNFKASFLGIPYKGYMVFLKLFLHSSYFAAIGLDSAALFLKCETAENVEIAAISCATAAFALTIINEKAEEAYRQHRESWAKQENCPIEKLEGFRQLNRFLQSFVALVKHIREARGKKEDGEGGGIDKTLLARCIARLQKIPDHMLEVQTGGKAEEIKYNWSIQIAQMASINYAPSSPRSAPKVSDCCFIELDRSDSLAPVDYSKMSLPKLMEKYTEEIAAFHATFNLEAYLEGFAVDGGLQNREKELMESRGGGVSEFIETMTALHEEITARKKKYKRTHCCPCLSTKVKLNALYVTQHIATVTFFCATSLKSIAHCEESFGFRKIVQVIEIVSGTISSIFQGATSWLSSRELDNKIVLANLMDAKIDDLEGIKQLNAFIESFLRYAEQLTTLGNLKALREGGELSLLENKMFEDVSEKQLKAAAKELFNRLNNCSDALEAIESMFLEQLVKVNGEVIKERWKVSLEMVYQRATAGIDLKPKYTVQLTSVLKDAFGGFEPFDFNAQHEEDIIEKDNFSHVRSTSSHQQRGLASLAKLASNIDMGDMYSQSYNILEVNASFKATLEQKDLQKAEEEEKKVPSRRWWQDHCTVL